MVPFGFREVDMKLRLAVGTLIVAAMGIVFVQQSRAQIPAGVAEGWNGEFDHAARQLTQLAGAIPADKFSWRPAPNVRSTSEVFMHIAIGNHLLLGQAGLKSPVDLAKLGKQPEKNITAKDEVIKFLQGSFDAVRVAAAGADRTKPAKFFGKPATVDGVLLRLLVHNHEHMGQLIGYARMSGVVPPWSAGSGGQ
jgi:hypothetical protein